MKIGIAIASLAFCVATSVSFAATPAPSSTPVAPQTHTRAQNTRSANALHCATGEVARKGKCVAAKPKH